MKKILNEKGFIDSIIARGYESAKVLNDDELLVDGEILTVSECIDIIQGRRKKEIKVEEPIEKEKPKRKRKKEID